MMNVMDNNEEPDFCGKTKRLQRKYFETDISMGNKDEIILKRMAM